MERALGYAGQMTNQAESYEAKAEEGMKADAKELKEKAKADQEKLIEKRREDREQLEARIEKSREAEGDTVQISEEGKAALQESAGAESTVPADSSTSDIEEIPPVVYTSAGEVNIQAAETATDLSVLA